MSIVRRKKEDLKMTISEKERQEDKARSDREYELNKRVRKTTLDWRL